jgi:SAM-dependent methyltransferase
MSTDIVDLRQFYHSALGQMATASIGRAIASVWPRLPDERLVGLGFTLPYLEQFQADAERTFAFMPAGQGAVNWPPGALSATALVFDEELPLPDASIDRILLVHSLEFAENPREALKELWRVLAPGGRLVIVVPNRRGVWARLEHTPFGSGQFHTRRLCRGAVLSALSEALDAEALPVDGAVRQEGDAALLRRHRRRGAEAALSGPAGLRPRLPPRLRAGAGATGCAVDAAEGDASPPRQLKNPGLWACRRVLFRTSLMSDVHFNKIALVGIGLIGSSIAHAVKARGLADALAISTRSPATLKRAEELGLGTSYHEKAVDAVRDADLVIVSVPVGASGAVAAEIASGLRPGAIVSDVGSTKASVIAQMAPHMPGNVHFIPGHPVAPMPVSRPSSKAAGRS